MTSKRCFWSSKWVVLGLVGALSYACSSDEPDKPSASNGGSGRGGSASGSPGEGGGGTNAAGASVGAPGGASGGAGEGNAPAGTGAAAGETNSTGGEGNMTGAGADGGHEAGRHGAESGKSGEDSGGFAGQDGGDAGQAGSGGGPVSPPVSVPAGCNRPLNQTVVTDFYQAMRCLFEGDDASQPGVNPGVILPARISVLRGRVLGRNGEPLEGVDVRVLHGEEYGETSSRVDGLYDLAVNGGGSITLAFEKSGFLRVQRRLPAQTRHFSVFPDVVLTEAGPASEPVVLADLTSVEVIGGARETDADGKRQHRIAFRPGTTATAVRADGSEEALDTVTLRMTEFTVGDLGPAAMPGELPATSSYTYAIDISTVEGSELGAETVTFDPPLASYVENFLAFPAGTIVPNGYFDRERHTWEAGESGIVLDIVGVSGGLAEIDVTGDGVADSESALGTFGIDDTERRALADTYGDTASLWRTELPHLTAWDHNWPFAPPRNAEPPAGAKVQVSAPLPNPTKSCGSIIGCEDQSLGEQFAIAGTPHVLHYQSERMPGRRDQRSFTLDFAGASAPDSVKATLFEVEILGQKHVERVEGPPSAAFRFTWDGEDPYGRAWQGRQEMRARVGYVYDGVYERTTRFGVSGNGIPITGDRARSEVTLWSNWNAVLGGFSQVATGFGGFSVGAHHVLDAPSGVLYLGDGSQRTAEATGGTIERVAGTGTPGFSGDTGAARDAELQRPHGFVVRPDGAVLFCDYLNHRIRIIFPDGRIDTFAGTGLTPSNGDGGPARLANVASPLGLALAPDGTVFVTDNGALTVRAIAPDGTISTIAGGGNPSDGVGDGGSALAAKFGFPHELAYGADGSIFVSDDTGNRVRRVAPDGTISTFAGTGTASSTGDGGLATAATVRSPRGLVQGPDGSLYIADAGGHRIRRVRPDGRIETIAGTGTAGFSGDGGPAISARLNSPHTLSMAADGSLYLSDEENRRLRRIRPDGTIVTIAGNGQTASAVEGRSPLAVSFRRPKNVHVHNDGTVWIVDFDDHSIWRIRPALPSLLVGETPIALDEHTVAVFDGDGRHLRTVDSILGVNLWSFGYDSNGLLASITDRFGLSTEVLRNAAGRAEAIVGPYGSRTELAYDRKGYLSRLENAAAEATLLEYTAEGLLTAWTEPLGVASGSGYRHEFRYDEVGRLLSDRAPSGLEQTLTREELASGHAVVLTRNVARPTRHELRPGAQATDEQRIITSPAGFAVTSTRSATGGTADSPTLDRAWTVSGDPRFGNQAGYVSQESITWQSGTVTQVSRARAVALNGGDPLSLRTYSESTSINGAVTANQYDRTTRTLTTTSPAGRVTSTVFDANGLPIEVRSAPFSPLRLAYDAQGRLIEERVEDRVTRYTYDPRGHLASLDDALGRTVAFERDAVGRIVRQVNPDDSQLDFTFDENGRLTMLSTDPLLEHAFGYAPGGLFAQYSPPPVAAASDSNWGFSYNAFEDVTAASMGGDAEAATYEYDAAGRLTGINHDGVTESFGYEAASERLLSASSSEVTLTQTYNGALPSRVTYSGVVTGTVDWLYDDDPRLTSETVAGTSAITFQYDADSLLTRVGTLTLTRAAESGFVTGSTLGLVTDVRSYNSFGELTNYTASVSGTASYARSDTFDAVGRVAERTESIAGQTHDFAYAYDSLGRLTSVLRDGQAYEAYTYDARGNRVQGEMNGTSASGAYDAQDRALSYGNATYEYTPDGKLSRRTRGTEVTEYDYDALGRLRTLTLPDGRVIEYVLDAFGRRTGRRVGGQLTHRWIYGAGNQLVADRGASGSTTVARYVYGSLRHVPDYMLKGSTVYRIVSDAIGSVRLVVNTADGNVAQRLEYDSFGRVLLDTNPGFQPFGFAGGLYDPDTALVRFGARDYDAEIGRWTAKDPILFAGGQVNLYEYAGSDPVNGIDVAGLCSCGKPEDVIAAARSDKRDWGPNADRSDVNASFPSGTLKCNLYVDTQYEAAGYSLPNTGGSVFSRWFDKYPPGAQSLSDSTYDVPGWPVVPGPAAPGDLLALDGHVGIVTEPGKTISASSKLGAPPGSVVENDWGFREGQRPVIRRCSCKPDS